jgi:predicted outer membrane repeat protein
MGSFGRRACGIGAAVLAGVALTTAPTAAQAAKRQVVIRIGCSSGALTGAIAASNGNPTVPYIVRLAPYCNYTYAAPVVGTTTALPVITGRIALIGGPSTYISATAAGFRLLNIGPAGRARVQGITIRNANLNPAAGENGGGILVQSTAILTLEHVTLSGNTTTAAPAGGAATGGDGGGLAIAAGGTAYVIATLIAGNTAAGSTTTVAGTSAGGLGGGIYNLGTLRLFTSRVDANNATSPSTTANTGDGGGLATDGAGSSRVVQSTFDHNFATNLGGGIYTNPASTGSTTIIRTLITLNRATSGGGIYGPRTITYSIVRNNTPDNCASPATPCGLP